MQVDRCNVPWSLPIFLGLVGSNVAEFDQELGESQLLLWRLLGVESGRRRPTNIVPERFLGIECGLGLEPVSLVLLGLAEAALEEVRAAHAVVHVVHVSWQLIHRALVLPRN